MPLFFLLLHLHNIYVVSCMCAQCYMSRFGPCTMTFLKLLWHFISEQNIIRQFFHYLVRLFEDRFDGLVIIVRRDNRNGDKHNWTWSFFLNVLDMFFRGILNAVFYFINFSALSTWNAYKKRRVAFQNHLWNNQVSSACKRFPGRC